MKEKIKSEYKEKENFLIFFSILIVSIILCFNFIRFHTVPDTYCILASEDYYSKVFFVNGRLVTGTYLYIGQLLNIPVVVLATIMGIISIVFLTLSVYILYDVIKNEKDSVIIKIIKLLGAYLFIFNPLSIEHFAYVESGIIIFGKFLCILAAKKLIIDKRKIIPFILVIIAGICYQGILNVFITTSVLFIVLQKDKKLKQKFWQLVWVGLISLITLIVVILTVKSVNNLLGTVDSRIGGLNSNRNYILLALSVSKSAMEATWNLFSKYFIPTVIVVSIILFITLMRCKNILNYLFVVLVAILSCSIPPLLGKYISIEARIITSVGSIIGISLIILGNSILENDKNYKKIIVLIFAIIIFGINSFNYINNGIMIYNSNKLEEEYLQNIADVIKQYEEANKIKINNIAFYYDKENEYTFLNYPNNSFTIKSIYTTYARRDSVQYFLNEKLTEVNPRKDIFIYFRNKNWTSFSKEQLIFENDTVHICAY